MLMIYNIRNGINICLKMMFCLAEEKSSASCIQVAENCLSGQDSAVGFLFWFLQKHSAVVYRGDYAVNH